MINVWDGSIIFFGTNNMQKTHEFYSILLELPLFKDQSDCKIYDIPKGGKIGFCDNMDVLTGYNTPEIVLLANDVDMVYAHITSAGYGIVPLPEINEKYNTYKFTMKDPNGYNVIIQSFSD